MQGLAGEGRHLLSQLEIQRVLADDDAVDDWEESWLEVVGGDRRRDADLSVAGS